LASLDVTDRAKHGISIDGFDFKPRSLTHEMRMAKGDGAGATGVVISHAGRFSPSQGWAFETDAIRQARGRFWTACGSVSL
jgi:hypothetical protein